MQRNLYDTTKGRFYALFLAFLPIVMMYRFPGVGMGISTVLIALGLVFALISIVSRFNKIMGIPIILLLFYLVYVAFKSDGNDYLLPVAILLHITAISTGAVNSTYLRRLLETISLFASICVITQQFAYILLGFHIPMIISSWIIDGLTDYVPSILTGKGIENLYRPCAFFLEPSHFTQYCMYGLGSCLYKSVPSTKKALIMSLGLFATTSGMGFVITFGIWGWWYITFKTVGKHRKNFAVRIIMPAIISIFLLLLLSQIPFFGQIVNRFTNDGSDYNAIDGRLFFWASQFGDKTIADLIYGFGEVALEEDVYYTGFMKILYAYGIIGMTLFSLFLIYLLIITRNLARMFVIIYIGLLFVANLTGFISIIFNVGVILTFYLEENKFCFLRQKHQITE